MDIDKPLDEIIDQKRAERRKNASSRGSRGRGAARGGAGRGASNAAAPAAAAAGVGPVRNKYSGNIAAANAAAPVAGKALPPAARVPLMADGSKIIVSNLPTDVTEHQIRDLFSQTVGPVTKLSLSYDKNGKSTGSATIELKRPGDAQLAFNSYNGRLVDGSRAMKVEILFDPTRAPPPPLNSRIAPAPVVPVAIVSPTAVAASGKAATRGGATARGTTRGGRGRGRGRGKGRGGDERPSVTADDLDADMDDYQKNMATAA